MEHAASVLRVLAEFVVAEIVAYLQGVLAMEVVRPGVVDSVGTDFEEETVSDLDHSVRSRVPVLD